ncbi:MAG TPA: nucleotidyl transferase AbiEii/AbiGii toxin family protein [Herpetosiphonaceae bacterium]
MPPWIAALLARIRRSPRPDAEPTTAAPPPPPSLYPATLSALTGRADSVERQQIFEPALKHYQYAYRLGDPAFASDDEAARWRLARRQVTGHVLRLIEASRWRDHLVLRGSALLKAWFGDAAREPGDIDWVFRPADVDLAHPMAGELFAELRAMLAAQPRAGEATIDLDALAIDDIWTYERAAGRRIIIPWRVDGLPPGEGQMDVVFTEELPVAPIEQELETPAGAARLWAAPMDLSLAWKLMWLDTDRHPQGKDLYDAVLLAERAQLDPALLKQVLHSADTQGWPVYDTIEHPAEWQVDWKNFQLEAPWVEEDEADWKARLAAALAPSITEYRRRGSA